MARSAFVLRVLLVGIGAVVLFGAAAGRASVPFLNDGPRIDTSETFRPRAKKLFIRGMTEAYVEDYEEAITNFEAALDLAPTEPVLLQALADAYGARGEYTTALFYARRARKHGKRRPYYHRRLAELQRSAGHPEAAIRTFRDLLARFPENVEAYRALAQLQSDLDRPRVALDTYDALLERQAHPSEAVYRNMVRLYRRLGNARGIRTTLEALVDLRPNDRNYRRQLSTFYAENGRPKAALDLLKPLFEATPNDPALRQQLRRLYRETGRPEAAARLKDPSTGRGAETTSVAQIVDHAESIYEKATVSPDPDTSLLPRAEKLVGRALRRAPDHVEALLLRSRIHEHTGAYRAAGHVLERALENNPRAPDRWARAARAYLKAGRYEKAASVADEGILLFPGHHSLARTAGFARLRLYEPKRALSHFRNALKLLDDSTTGPSEWALLKAGQGLAYDRLDRREKAEAAFHEALSDAPNHPLVLSRYAYSLARRSEQLDRALAFAQRAIEQAPANATALGTLGWVHFQMGNLKAARSTLRKALVTGPSSSRLLEHYGDVQHAVGNETAARQYWQKALDRAPHRKALRKKLGRDTDP